MDLYMGAYIWTAFCVSQLCANQNEGVTSPPQAYTQAFDF